MAKQIEEKKETLDEMEKTEVALRRILKEIDRFLSNELSIDIEKAIQQKRMLFNRRK